MKISSDAVGSHDRTANSTKERLNKNKNANISTKIMLPGIHNEEIICTSDSNGSDSAQSSKAKNEILSSDTQDKKAN